MCFPSANGVDFKSYRTKHSTFGGSCSSGDKEEATGTKGKFKAMRNNESWCFDRASRGGLTRSAAKRRHVLNRCSLNSEKRGRRAEKSEHRLLERLLLTKRKENLHPSLSGRHLAAGRAPSPPSSRMEGRGWKTRTRQEDV